MIEIKIRLQESNRFATKMDFTQKTQTVNLNKVKYLMMEKLVDLLIENNAVIFGGFVRDKYIHDHYADIFHEKSLEIDKFSDETYSPETKGRLLVAKDIDVFCKGDNQEVDHLISIIREAGFHISDKESNLRYFKDKNVQQRKATVRINNVRNFGLPNVEVLMDILYSNKDDIEPPFGKLDVLCNGFLLDKRGMRLSNQTGTPADRCGSFNRKREEVTILQKMINFETDIAIPDEDDDSMEKQSIKNRKIRALRVIKIQQSDWTVNNKVYTINNNISKLISCHICDGSFNDCPVIRLNCCDQVLHINCFLDHIKSEYDDRVTSKCCNSKCGDLWEF